MSNIDEQIRQALSEEEHSALEQIDDQAGLLEMVGMSMRGKQAWMTYYMWTLGMVAFFVGLYCLREFFATDDLKTALAWTLAIGTCLAIIVVIKVIGWSQMQKLELMREIKRLEVRLLLAAESGPGQS